MTSTCTSGSPTDEPVDDILNRTRVAAVEALEGAVSRPKLTFNRKPTQQNGPIKCLWRIESLNLFRPISLAHKRPAIAMVNNYAATSRNGTFSWFNC